MITRGSRLGRGLLFVTGVGLALEATSCGSTHAANDAAQAPITSASTLASGTPVSSGVPSSEPAASTTSTAAVPSLPPGAVLSTLKNAEASGESGVYLAPPAAGDVATATPADAYRTFSTEEPFNVSGDPSIVELATYTNKLNSGIPTPGVSASSWDHSMLVWAIVYSPIGPIWRAGNLGPAGPYAASQASASATATSEPTDCNFVFLASATTGRYVTAFGACPGDLLPVPSDTASSVS